MEKDKRIWLTQTRGTSLAVFCLCAVMMQACSPRYPEPDKKPADSTSTSTSTTTGSTPQTTTTTTTDSTASKVETPTDTKSGADGKQIASNSSDKTATNDKKTASSSQAASDPNSLLRELPELRQASEKVDLRKMPDTDVIVSIKNTPLTVGDYKQELKMREAKASALISSDPRLVQQLLDEAKHRNLTLTADEKKKLVETSNKAEAAASPIKNYLKENKISSQEFEGKILQVGLALKTAALMTRETLLNELVDQELLVLAAKDRNLYPKAFNKYIESKRTPEYQQFLSQTGLTADQAQKQVIDRELIGMYIQYLKDQNSTVSDSEIQKVYDENKDRLKHGERFKLSQIVFAAPTDSQDQPGIKQQLKTKFSTLSDKDLEAKANEYKGQQKKKADGILARILKGEKFEELANQYTEDPGSNAAANGGDIGWKEKDQLEPDFVSKVSTLKVGQIYPHVLTTRFGYHILKLTGKEGPGTTPLPDVKETIKQQLIQEKQIKAVAKLAQRTA